MLFNSLQFIIFFPIVVILYFSIPYRYRWVFLLAASYYFYMCWKPEYIILIVISTLIDYYASLQMGKTERLGKRKIFLMFSIFTNLGLLFSFKYFNFFSKSLHEAFNIFNIGYTPPILNVLLPVGISFYTFQTMSYTIDVYRGCQKPEKHFGKFALFVTFFPQLVAGPIERSVNLLPQFTRKNDFNYNRASEGIKLMMWGFFKKIVIADRLAYLVNRIYSHPGDYNGFPLILATYFFAFQIYCDFSGYSDIAIGAAKVLGYDLMENFRRPYFSKSISEFWKRWHISLSTWFRDYLYIPLGGKRVPLKHWYFNLFITFVISGIWHGANWTFLIWGALHGFYMVFSHFTEKLRARAAQILRLDLMPGISRIIKTSVTFHLVVFSWIFFRAGSLKDAFIVIRRLFDLTGNLTLLKEVVFSKSESISVLGMPFSEVLFAVFCIFILLSVQMIQRRGPIHAALMHQPVWLRWGVYYAVTIFVVMFGKYGGQDFIYFQF